jgi:hypothetical protein
MGNPSLEETRHLACEVLDVSRALRADLVCDTVEYLESQMNSGKRNGVENPAGLIKHLSPAVAKTAREKPGHRRI